MSTDTVIQTLAQRAAVEMRSEWATLVELSLRLEDDRVKPVAGALSVHTRVGADSIERKINAIRHAKTLGHSDVEIIAMGQEKILGTFIKARKQANYTDQVIMKFYLPGSLRELFQQDMRRIMDVLKLPTSTDFFDWLHNQLCTLTDEQIQESAGEER